MVIRSRQNMLVFAIKSHFQILALHKPDQRYFETKAGSITVCTNPPIVHYHCVFEKHSLDQNKDWQLKKKTKVYSRFLIEKNQISFLFFYLHFPKGTFEIIIYREQMV